MNTIWVASYPKSGNTWVRFLLSHLVCPDLRSSAEIEASVPDIHKTSNRPSVEVNKSGLIKTHFLPGNLPEGHKTVGAVYVYRDPLDVLASHLNYFELSPDSSEARSFVRSYLNESGPPRWAQLGFGTWEQHITQWALTPKEFPVLAVSYESLKIDTQFVMTQIADFLCIEVSQGAINTACERSTAESLKRLEEKEVAQGVQGFFSSEQRGKSREFRFIKEAKVNRASRVLPPKILQEAQQHFSRFRELLYSTGE